MWKIIGSEDVSLKSGLQRGEDRRRHTEPNFASLEGTVVSTLCETGPRTESNLNIADEGDKYDAQSLLFSKQKETLPDPNMTFGGQDFRFKLSDKKVVKHKGGKVEWCDLYGFRGLLS